TTRTILNESDDSCVQDLSPSQEMLDSLIEAVNQTLKVVSSFHLNEEIVLPSFCPAPVHRIEKALHTLDVSGASHLLTMTSSSCLHTAALAQVYFVCPVEGRAKYCSAQAPALSDLSRRLRTAVLCSALNRADKVRRSHSVKIRRERHRKKMGGPGPQRDRPWDLFIANSQKYAQETVLSLRVREWEDKMGPQLQEQEDRGAFDIHDYGDRLVSQFSRVGEWRSFASLMANRQPYEVCRYMLASLQLANDYTVEVSQKPQLHEGLDTMALRLLSQQKAHERFKTYTAPSVSDQ
ncbi:unnamed protein product, partial [Ranitomeya imitator]